jgi:CheY-like chemotaxis protein
MPGNQVLVVEDETIIRLLVEEVLSDGGFEIASAVTGEEAIELLDNPAHEFVGLVTDIRLGDHLTGWDIARHARELNPEICIVYVSADSGDEWRSLGVPGSMFIQKPFASAQIVTAISTLLNAAGGQSGHAPD